MATALFLIPFDDGAQRALGGARFRNYSLPPVRWLRQRLNSSLGAAADLRLLSRLHGSQAAHRDSQNLDITTLVKITTQGCDYVDHLREP